MTLVTERLRLHEPTPDDWPAYRAYYLSPRYARIRGEMTEGIAWRAFATLRGHWRFHGFGRFVVSHNGQSIGLIGPNFPGGWPEREIAWHLWSDAVEGTGLAHEAAAATLRHAFLTLKWDTAVSYIDDDNARSIRLAERLGATLDPEAPQRPEYPSRVYRHDREAWS